MRIDGFALAPDRIILTKADVHDAVRVPFPSDVSQPAGS
jgi:hypothetical protein